MSKHDKPLPSVCACAARGRVIATSVSMSVCLEDMKMSSLWEIGMLTAFIAIQMTCMYLTNESHTKNCESQNYTFDFHIVYGKV